MAAFGEAPLRNADAERVHDDYIRSRAAIRLDVEAREAAERSREADEEVGRTLLVDRRPRVIARIGTQQGREIELARTPIGIQLRDAAVRHHAGVLAELNDDQGQRLLEALAEALGRPLSLTRGS